MTRSRSRQDEKKTTTRAPARHEKKAAEGITHMPSRCQENDRGDPDDSHSEVHLTAKLRDIEEVLSEEIKVLRLQIGGNQLPQEDDTEREDEEDHLQEEEYSDNSPENSQESKDTSDEKQHGSSPVSSDVAEVTEDSKDGERDRHKFASLLDHIQTFSNDISHLKKEVSRMSNPLKQEARRRSTTARIIDSCDSDDAEPYQEHHPTSSDFKASLADIFERINNDIHVLKQDVAYLATLQERQPAPIAGGDSRNSTSTTPAPSNQTSASELRGLHVVSGLSMSPTPGSKYVTEVTAVSVIQAEDEHERSASPSEQAHRNLPNRRKGGSELGGDDGDSRHLGHGSRLASKTPTQASAIAPEDRRGFVAQSPNEQGTKKKQMRFPSTPDMSARANVSAGSNKGAKQPPFGKLQSSVSPTATDGAQQEFELGEALVSSSAHLLGASSSSHSHAQSFAIDELASP